MVQFCLEECILNKNANYQIVKMYYLDRKLTRKQVKQYQNTLKFAAINVK